MERFGVPANLALRVWVTAFVLTPLLAAGSAWSQETSQSPVTKAASNPETKKSGLVKEGGSSTLPPKIFRARLPLRLITGSYGFDGAGNKSDLGFKTKVVASALVLEYGVTRDTTLQMLAPYIIENNVRINSNKFRKTKIYQEKYNEFADAVADLLQDRGICANEQQCLDLVASGYSLPQDEEVTLPTGEKLVAKAGVPLRDYADSLVVGGAAPAAGGTGWGDLQIGALTRLYSTSDMGFAVGYGIRLPTGDFKDVPSGLRATGSGVVDAGLRVNWDYRLVDNLWFNFQNQSEIALTEGRKRKTSLLDNTKTNTGDPTSPAALAVGSNGESNTQRYALRGVSQAGFAGLQYGFGGVAHFMRGVSADVSYNYALGRVAYLDGQRQGGPSLQQKIGAGVGVSALPYKVPLSTAISYAVPVAGRDVQMATQSLSLTAKVYTRF